MKTLIRRYCKECFTNATDMFYDVETKQKHFNVGKCPNEHKHKETDK